MNKSEVIIIGSGLGGLCCGVILSKSGMKVRVVEKEPHAGGCLRSYRRDGVTFDTGIHYIGSMNEGEILRQFMRYAGVEESLTLQRLDTDAYDVVGIDGREVAFAQGDERFVERLCDSFPHERDNIRRYAAAVREVGEVIGVERLRQGVISSGSLQYMSLSASEVIDSITGDEHLRRVLAGTSFLEDGIRNYTPFYHHAMIQHSYIRGAYRIADGSSRWAEALCRTIVDNGGEVRCGDAVTEVLHADNAVTGVRLASGETCFADTVISDIHPAVLLPMIAPGSRIREVYVRRINNARNSMGVFTLNLTLDGALFPYLNRNYYLHSSGSSVWRNREEERFSDVVMCAMQATGHDSGRRGMSLMMPMSYAEVERWADSHVGRRGEEYLDFKHRTAEGLLRRAESRFPDLRHAVLASHTSSPLTYRDYTATHCGSAYGMMTDCRNVMTTLLSPSTKLDGLYLTGQNIAVHGALGVVMSALSTCGALLGEAYVAHQIGDI